MNNEVISNKNISKWLIISFLLVAFIGFTDAAYLTTRYYRGISMGCFASLGCDKVAISQYATIGGIPVALIGIVYYFIILLTVAYYLWQEKEKIIYWLSRFTVVGFLASAWFVYLQLFIIKTICFYCMVSAAASTILFILGLIVIFKKNKGRV